jgi:hypothetical protein
MARQGKHVTGNQEGSVDIKKIRTWRQYMNRYATLVVVDRLVDHTFLLGAAGSTDRWTRLNNAAVTRRYQLVYCFS